MKEEHLTLSNTLCLSYQSLPSQSWCYGLSVFFIYFCILVSDFLPCPGHAVCIYPDRSLIFFLFALFPFHILDLVEIFLNKAVQYLYLYLPDRHFNIITFIYIQVQISHGIRDT